MLGYRGIAQLVEHWSPKPGVESSSLSTPAKKTTCFDKSFFIHCEKSIEKFKKL